MPDEPQPSEAPRSAPQFVFYLVPLVIVLAVGALFFKGGGKSPGSAKDKEQPKPPAKVEVGHDYYVIVTLMEFHPHKTSGEKWDIRDSAPDIFYELQWHDQTIFSTKNDVAKNALIAHWIGLGADIKITDLGKILMPGGKRLTPLNAVKAALISVEKDDELVIRTFDKDPLSDDPAGQCALRVTDLKHGDNEFFIDTNGSATRDRGELAKDRGGLKRLTLRVVDSSLPIEELVKALR